MIGLPFPMMLCDQILHFGTSADFFGIGEALINCLRFGAHTDYGKGVILVTWPLYPVLASTVVINRHVAKIKLKIFRLCGESRAVPRIEAPIAG